MKREPMVKGNRVQVTIQLDHDQATAIDSIVSSRRTTRAAVLRNAVDIFLAVNRSENRTHTILASDSPEAA